MAASETCVANLCADAHQSHAQAREYAPGQIGRAVAHVTPVLADFLAAAVTSSWIVGFSSGPALSLRQRVLIGVVAAVNVVFSRACVRNSTVGSVYVVLETEWALRAAAQSQFVVLLLTVLLSRHLPIWTYAVAPLITASSIVVMRRMTSSWRRIRAAELATDNHFIDTELHDVNQVAPYAAPLAYVRLFKRALDIGLAVVLLIAGAAVFLVIAILIRLDSRGPVLFVQKRVGHKGKLFYIYKFRTMQLSASPYELSPTRSSDPRITGVGRILRRTGLDELPQLLNVLRGDMSLVGPRPEMPFLVKRHIEQHRLRLQVSPGITGLWQLSKERALPIHQNPHYDLFYIRNRTCYLDLAILFHTLLFSMRGGV